MKKITFFLITAVCLNITNNANAQLTNRLIADFEDQTTGIFTTQGPHITMTPAENPSKTGDNTSDYVLMIEAGAETDKNWESVYSIDDKTTNSFEISDDPATGYRYLHFKVYKNFTSKMLWEFTDNSGKKQPEEKQNEKTGEWDYIVVDLLWLTESWNITAGTYHRINFNMWKMPEWNTHFGAYTGYLDDIYLSTTKEKISAVPSGISTLEQNNPVSISRLDNQMVQISIGAEAKAIQSVEVYNVQGQLLHSIGNGIAGESFEINLPAGNLYLLRVSANEGAYSKKF